MLTSRPQAHRALSFVWDDIKAALDAGERLELIVRPATRTSAQNALLHKLLTSVSKGMEWAGKRRHVETWKRLCTAAWLRARGESVEVLPAIDGHGIDVVFRRTSDLNVAECSELLDFVQCWAAENGIETSELEQA